MRQRIATLAALLLTLALVGLAGTAHAASRTVRDGNGPEQQRPAYQLERGMFRYTADRTVLKAKIDRVVRKRTWVGAHVYYPDGSSIWLRTFHRRNGDKVVAAVYLDGDERTRLRANARWNYKRDTVTFAVNNRRQDPKPGNRRATLDLYTVTRGWDHGPACSPMPHLQPRSQATAPRAGAAPTSPPTVTAHECNDDYVSVRLRR